VKRAKRKLPGSPHGTLIRVGGATEVEVKEKKDRVDDATHATRAAVEEGIVPGGGVALLYAAKALDGLTAENSDQVGIVKRALQSPVRRVAENAGDDGSVVVGKLLDSNDRAVTPTDSLRHVFFSTRSESKESEPSKPFQNERKIVARRRRRTSLCNKASLYQEYTWLVKFLVFEPRTQVLTRCPDYRAYSSELARGGPRRIARRGIPVGRRAPLPRPFGSSRETHRPDRELMAVRLLLVRTPLRDRRLDTIEDLAELRHVRRSSIGDRPDPSQRAITRAYG
jgi:TCP-1/cpn60 chaperonin family